jgi:hypothetical protein
VCPPGVAVFTAATILRTWRYAMRHCEFPSTTIARTWSFKFCCFTMSLSVVIRTRTRLLQRLSAVRRNTAGPNLRL